MLKLVKTPFNILDFEFSPSIPATKGNRGHQTACHNDIQISEKITEFAMPLKKANN